MSDAVTPQDFPEIRWRGHWIWVPEEPVVPNFALVPTANPDPKEAHGLFRKTIRLDSVPERVPARITADSRYVLFANG
jgi:alpha-L-rhamnosidase